MIATDAPTIPVVEHTYTAGLTPKGEAVRQLIRRNWFRDSGCWHRASERFADLVAPLGLAREDVAAVAALWAEHYTD